MVISLVNNLHKHILLPNCRDRQQQHLPRQHQIQPNLNHADNLNNNREVSIVTDPTLYTRLMLPWKPWNGP